jgi:enterochelin esterase-like enzyme
MLPLILLVLGGLLTGFALRARRLHHAYLNSIEVITLRDVASSRLGNKRDVWVYLPPGYRQEPDSRYEVLYIHDGQERETLGLRETLARLMISGKIRPLIAVAVPTNDNRLHEYGTAVAPNRLSLGAQADAYTHFLVEELMPLIDREFRTKPGAVLLGMSLGGLSAFDIAWRYPDRFAAVGVMSGSFWWRAADDEANIDPGRRIPHALVRRAQAASPLLFWFQAGTRDEVCDRDGDGVIDAIQDTLELAAELVASGCGPEQITYQEVKGGRHDYETWSRVLPDFLTWAFSRGMDRQTAGASTGFRPLR